MFKNSFNKLIGLSKISSRDVIGINYSASNLKLVHIRISLNKKELVRVISRDISGRTDDEVAGELRSAVIGLKANEPAIVNVVSAHSVITKNIEIPSVNPSEIREIINLQAGRHTPYSRDEIVVDYLKIGVYKNNYTKILLVIVARSIIKKFFDITRKAGIKLSRVFFSPEGIALSLPKVLKFDTKDSPVAVLHLQEESTDFIVVFNNTPLYVRSFPLGAKHFITFQRDKFQEEFCEEIKRSLEAYQGENIERNPNLIILSGAIEDLAGIETNLNNYLHIPVRSSSYFKNILISDGALLSSQAANQLSFLDIVSCLLSMEELSINLIPEEVRIKKTLEDRGRELIKAGIFALAIFIIGFLILISKIYFKNTYLIKLDNKYKALNEEAKDLEKDFSKLAAIRKCVLSRGIGIGVLSEIHKLAPLELKIDYLKYDPGKFSIRGAADSMLTVFSFVDNMERSGYFSEVKTEYTTKRKEGEREVVDFKISSTIKGPKA